MDVARVLLAPIEHLAPTDIAEHALATLRTSRVEQVILLGRRGPAQAAFSPKEIEEIAELPDVDVLVDPREAELDPLSAAWLEKDGARSQQRNVKFLQERAAQGPTGKPKTLRCRFLVGPTALHGQNGALREVQIEHMTLVADASGTPCIFDPAVCGGSREMDLAMMRLFGGFPRRAFDAYEESFPLLPGHEERVALYQLYYLLVHVAIFGSGYVAQTEGCLRTILR